MEQREESEYPQELEVGPQLGGTDQVIEYHFDNKEVEERNKEEENRTTKVITLMSWLRKMWTAPTAPRVQNEEEDNPSTGPNMNPGNAEVVDTETSSDLEEGGEKPNAPASQNKK